MFKRLFCLICIFNLAFLISVLPYHKLHAESVLDQNIQTDHPLLLAHYMPWYQTPAVSGYWGWHWTMNHFNPDERNENGRREIASHYYPVTGPYDSSDEKILEYQVLLMKICGVDGVIVDWYGNEDFWDYAALHDATRELVSYIDLAELHFSICYEDQTIGHMVDESYIEESEAIEHGKSVMQYLEDNWFHSSSYIKIDDRPVLLTFGPQYFRASSDWATLFTDLDPQPLFFTLDNRLYPVAAGAFPWPPMWASVNDILTQDALNNYLSNFYQKASSWDYLVAGAFPAFNDIYAEAELGYNYGYLDPQDGATFESTMQTALDQNPDIVQIITWNDYGEGTIVEPTREFELQYLEIIQEIKKTSIDPEWIYTAEDLNLPILILNLRKQYESDGMINGLLDDVFDMIVFGEIESARAIIDSLTSLTQIDAENKTQPANYTLSQNYPNPFNPTTEIAYRIPKSGEVRLTVYNISGQEIAILVDDVLPAGLHYTRFSAHDLPASIYLYKLETADFTNTRKMILLP
ncbi:T9SS type A sorting domain-containing protein [candidate division KSB1 bacterium]|nr:T9SS type A sorting domain-containing protein [candidate division KSB1 bacterium]